MAEPILYRVVEENPYLSREEEFAALTLEGAAGQVEDLTGTEAAQIVSEVEEGVLPWCWRDIETGREVTLRPEVE